MHLGWWVSVIGYIQRWISSDSHKCNGVVIHGNCCCKDLWGYSKGESNSCFISTINARFRNEKHPVWTIATGGMVVHSSFLQSIDKITCVYACREVAFIYSKTYTVKDDFNTTNSAAFSKASARERSPTEQYKMTSEILFSRRMNAAKVAELSTPSGNWD